jgi:hypothetical protein
VPRLPRAHNARIGAPFAREEHEILHRDHLRLRVAARTLEHAQQIPAHASPKTTKLYDRTSDTISLDEIERILI